MADKAKPTWTLEGAAVLKHPDGDAIIEWEPVFNDFGIRETDDEGQPKAKRREITLAKVVCVALLKYVPTTKDKDGKDVETFLDGAKKAYRSSLTTKLYNPKAEYDDTDIEEIKLCLGHTMSIEYAGTAIRLIDAQRQSQMLTPTKKK